MHHSNRKAIFQLPLFREFRWFRCELPRKKCRRTSRTFEKAIIIIITGNTRHVAGRKKQTYQQIGDHSSPYTDPYHQPSPRSHAPLQRVYCENIDLVTCFYHLHFFKCPRWYEVWFYFHTNRFTHRSIIAFMFHPQFPLSLYSIFV